MQIACPACNKINAAQFPVACQRCGCELQTLAAITDTAAGYLAEAVKWLRRGEWEHALVDATLAWRLGHSASSARVAFLAASALGDPVRACSWRRRAGRFPES